MQVAGVLATHVLREAARLTWWPRGFASPPLGRFAVSAPVHLRMTPDQSVMAYPAFSIQRRTMPIPPPRGGCRYSMSSKILNIGMYNAMTIPPTIPPRTPIISGSSIAVRDSVAEVTSES